MDELLILSCGGTIDKEYPKTLGGYAFEMGSSAAEKVILRANPAFKVKTIEVMRKDSLDMTAEDRKTLAQAIQRQGAQKVLITHGTSTMVETAKVLAGLIDSRVTVVVTGAFKPECIVHSDAAFNVGVAVGSLGTLPSGVYIAMQGKVFPWDEILQNTTTGFFESKL